MVAVTFYYCRAIVGGERISSSHPLQYMEQEKANQSHGWMTQYVQP